MGCGGTTLTGQRKDVPLQRKLRMPAHGTFVPEREMARSQEPRRKTPYCSVIEPNGAARFVNLFAWQRRRTVPKGLAACDAVDADDKTPAVHADLDAEDQSVTAFAGSVIRRSAPGFAFRATISPW